MPQKVLGQAGISVADVYDVEGSIVGVGELDADSVKAVHDFGPQIQSERLNVFNLIADSTAVLQNVAWNIALGGFPDSVNRLLSIAVIADNIGRIANCSIHIGDPVSGIDHPIWAWDAVTAGDSVGNIRWADPVLQTDFVLLPIIQIQKGPTILARTGVGAAMPNLIFRGISNGFGAGTITVRAFIQVARPDGGNPGPGEPSSHGLPLPSW